MKENDTSTYNQYEIESSPEVFSFVGFKNLLDQYELGGDTPESRVKALRVQSREHIALFLTDLNRKIQGQEEVLIHDKTMKIGDKETVKPEDRYNVFAAAIERIHNSDESINPARIGDALALTTVLLHPFSDGNGRTSRAIGFLYRPEFDLPEDEAEVDFNQLIESRDEKRKKRGFIINGYIPYMEEGIDQSDPQQIDTYINRLLTDDQEGLYTGPYGDAPLKNEEVLTPSSPQT